jgi:farnesyl-diphosphate farnesyltransferase
MMEEHELGGKLLAGVSRSFYLTLKALPGGLREPLSLAYLLARAADTIADTTKVDGALKLAMLAEFDSVVHGAARDAGRERALVLRLHADFVPHQTDEHEKLLLLRLGEVFDALAEAPERAAANIRGVLTPIVRGQVKDIERFPTDGSLRALETADDLHEYTWLVAGCVGEFWTRLCAEIIPDSFAADVTLDVMVERGVRFGRGLQLVNILRDVGKDAMMGRCYIPRTEIEAAGLTVDAVATDLSKLKPLLPKWQALCREHLQRGLDYVESVRHRRLKFAAALPLLLGFKTLAQIEAAPWEERMKGVKVSRGDVGKLMLQAGIAVLRKDGVRKMVPAMLS